MSDVWTPPRAEVKDLSLSGNPDAPDIRRAHLNHEASIKALGALYYLGAIGLLAVGIIEMVAPSDDSVGVRLMIAVFALGLGGLYFWIGRGLRGLKSRARIPAVILAVIGLLGFPVGTLINGYILYLLLSAKGTMVFSDEYKQIIADTPDIKYRTSIIVWIFLGLLVALVAAAFIGAMVGH